MRNWQQCWSTHNLPLLSFPDFSRMTAALQKLISIPWKETENIYNNSFGNYALNWINLIIFQDRCTNMKCKFPILGSSLRIKMTLLLTTQEFRNPLALFAYFLSHVDHFPHTLAWTIRRLLKGSLLLCDKIFALSSLCFHHRVHTWRRVDRHQQPSD